jgi:dienelactone hydrolase
VLIHFHGAPGGRGMDKLVEWSSGSTGGPVWERFLQEGYVVVVADYRRVPGPNGIVEPAGIQNMVGFVDDGVAVVEYVRSLPWVDANRITAYGVSLGGDLVANLAARLKLNGAILGAPAPFNFLGARFPTDEEREKNIRPQPDPAKADRNVAAVQCPVLIFAGTADSLLPMDRDLHERLAAAGKSVWLEVYRDGYHDFVMGPQGHPGRKEPLMGATLDALDRAVRFARAPASYK